MKNLLKDWTLPISMAVGALAYLLLTQVAGLSEVKQLLSAFVPYLLPCLIFLMLFFTYCKINPREFKPRRWHLWLVLIQLAEVLILVWWLTMHKEGEFRPFGEAMLACCISPMAAVGAVVTQKIGGNAATATTYTLVSSAFTAIAVPFVYPLVEPGMGMTFVELFLKILARVFPTIMAPLFVALILHYIWRSAKQWVGEKSKDYSFYLWAICTAVNTAQIIRNIVNSPGSGWMLVYICLGVALLVVFQFVVGKQVGGLYGDRIAAGQGLAQKNTILSIWMAMTFLRPEAVIGPGACLLWQNVFNSWQIYSYGKKSRVNKA